MCGGRIRIFKIYKKEHMTLSRTCKIKYVEEFEEQS